MDTNPAEEAPRPKTGFRSGFVVLAGRPNAGKSTLLNALLGSKLSIVSAKPQTTRHKILGILNGPDFQICFLDTPGLLVGPKDDLRQTLLRIARGALRSDADAVVLLAEPQAPDPEFVSELSALKSPDIPLIVAVNKADQKPLGLDEVEAAWTAALSPKAVVRISALKGTGVPALLETIKGLLPEGEPYYERGQLSDRYERFFVSEIIREKIFELFEEEVPHACAVQIEQFREAKGRPDEIMATVFVERDSQKGILIGKAGRMIRELRERSANSAEAFLGRKVRLEITIKVRKDWRKDPRSLKEFGYLG
ncbi:MAG: GTPase Era [Elusimicrobia bacterium]|nr:GTPase Era [Elusimicrobiota bacterium]